MQINRKAYSPVRAKEPLPPRPCSPLFAVEKLPPFRNVAWTCSCSRHAFVIRDMQRKKKARRGKLFKSWNRAKWLLSNCAVYVLLMYSSTYRVVGQAPQLADHRLPPLWSSINTVKGLSACRCCNYTMQVVCVHKHSRSQHFVQFAPIEDVQGIPT